MGFERIYDYDDVPTIRRFNQSDKFFRMLMGPFGCLSNDTEYLSLTGWKRFDQYRDGDEIAEFNTKTNRIQFTKPLSYIKLPCDSFLHLKNKYGIDQLLSDEHTVLFNTKFKPDEWRTITAFDLAESHNKLNHGWSGRIPTTFKAAEMPGLYLSDDEIRLMVAISADGSFHPATKTTRCSLCVRKDRKKERIRMLLAKCEISWTEHNASARPTETTFRFNAPERNKLLWNYICADEKQLAIIADEFVYWDGCLDCYGGRIFASVVKENADFVQYALATIGVRSTISIIDNTGHSNWKDGYRLYAGTQATELSMRQAPKIERVKSEDGYKYCFATSTGFFVARRNGRIFITGNSGKSSGCVAEIIDIGMKQQPSKDGIRRTKWAVVRNCYDDQTEVLTENRGWRLFKDLTENDKVGIYENGNLVFEIPKEKSVDKYTGEMIGFKTSQIDFLVTPDHLLYVSHVNRRKEEWTDFYKIQARDIYGKSTYKFKTIAKYTGDKTEKSLDFFEFLGFYFAEGCVTGANYNKRDRLVITQKNRVEYVEDLLNRNGFEYSKNSRGVDKGFNFVLKITESSELLCGELKKHGTSLTKSIPNWIKQASTLHLQSFIYGFSLGDGHIRKNKNDTTRLYTSSRSMADNLQEICFKCGYPSRLIHQKNGQNTITLYQAKFINPLTANKKHWYKVQYDGFVYCVSVSSGLVVTRRNGKISINSNTYKQLIDTTQATFFYWLPPDLFGKYNITNHHYVINKIPMEDGTRVEIEILFRALDKEEDVRNLLSLELTGAWFNEVREISRFIVNHTEGRCRRYPKDVPITWTGVIADTNPPDQYSWIYKFFEETVPKDAKNEGLADQYEIFKQPSGRSDQAENLLGLGNGDREVGKKYYTNLAIGKDPEFVKVYCDGEYGVTRDGKPVYRNYMDSLHCAKEEIEALKGIPIIASYDFGHTPACVFSQFTPNGKFHVLKEFWSENSGIRNFVTQIVKPYIMAKYRGFEIVSTGDKSGIKRNDTDERNCFIELKALGYPATPSYTNEPLARINAVDVFLTKMIDGKPAFQLSPSCEMLRRGFISEYQYKVFKGVRERVDEKPEKNEFSHVHDALQYGALLADTGGAIGTRGLLGSRYEAPINKPSRSSPMLAWT